MLTQQHIISALHNPALIADLNIDELQGLVNEYPYSEPFIWLYLAKLKSDNDESFEEKLNEYAIFISNRRWLYNILYGSNEPTPINNIIVQPTVTDYFQTMNNEEQKETLTQLAQRLREARMAKAQTIANTNSAPTPPPQNKSLENEQQLQNKDNTLIDKEQKVKTLLKEKKYTQALEILRDLSTANPKKSVYFAPQIRFIETILENINK